MTSSFSAFHFAQPLWLFGLLIPPLVWAWLRVTVSRASEGRLQRYADAHLLPHLLRYREGESVRRRRRLTAWTLIWTLGILALAGPRWDYRDTSLFQGGADLLLLLDLSRSMEARDVLPSRLGRAKQEVEDLLALNAPLRMGLIAFASVAHVVAPITEDRETLAHVLPALRTDLVRLQGSRLSAALARAERLFLGQPEGNPHAILLISDGDFEEPDLEAQVQALAARGIALHVLGIGTPEGARLPTADGDTLRDRFNQPVVSRLDEIMLRRLARAGQGVYRRADYQEDDIGAVVDAILAHAPEQTAAERRVRIWHERYYWLVGLALLLVLPWFRRTPAAGSAAAAREQGA